MNMYVSTRCLKNCQDITRVLNVYQTAGLRKIELGSGHEYFPRILNNLILENKNCYLVHNYFPPERDGLILNIASGDEQIRRRSIDFIKRTTTFCSKFGIELYSFHIGLLSDPQKANSKGFVFGDKNVLSPNKAFSLTVDSLKEICDYVGKKGVKIAVENNPCSREKGRFLQFCEAGEFKKLFQKVGYNNLGLLVDIGHLKISAKTRGFDRLEFIHQLKSRIFGLHVHDNNGTEDEHKLPDESSWIFDLLKKEFRSTEVPIVLESTNMSITKILKAIDILEEVIG